ncbi:hypothetical protein PSPO01_05581 [Paraphaeosphaeria sporulosa]
MGPLHRPRSRRDILRSRLVPVPQRRRTNYLEIDTHSLGVGHVHHVGDNVSRAVASAHPAGADRSKRAGGLPALGYVAVE